MRREMDAGRDEAGRADVERSRRTRRCEKESRTDSRRQCPPLAPLGEFQLDTRLSRSNTTRPPLESG